MAKSRYTIPIPSARCASYGDTLRVNARHYGQLCHLADAGGYATLGQLLAAILDAALPHVKLVDRPKYDIMLVGLDDDAEDE